jgi:hypothetical protein
MTGTSGSAYMLEGSTSELGNHVGEQVEVTGHMEGSMASGSGASGSGTTSSGSTTGLGGSTSGGTARAGSASGTGMSGSAGSAAGGARLRVDSVRTIASTCTGQ